jgi:hypothetical protein
MNTVAVWAFNAPVSVFHNAGDYTLGGEVGSAAGWALLNFHSAELTLLWLLPED